VHEMTCFEVNESAPEFALGILTPEEQESVGAHLRACPTCRLEVESMQSVSDQLLDLIPGTEPPLGFDRRVLSRVGSPLKPARRRFRMIATLAAAAVIAIAATIGADAGRSSHPAPVLASAVLYHGSERVGQVYVRGGNPPWIAMTMHSVATDGKITCEVVGTDGSVTKVGTFGFEYGRGSWSTPDPAIRSGLAGVRLVDDHGDVVASARFP
jgi:hypothetical protein